MLSDRLRVLETEGLVERRVVPDTPVRVEYQLTEKGRSLEGALGAIGSWAEKWIDPAPDRLSESRERGVQLPATGVAPDPRLVAPKPRIKPKVPAST